MDTKSQSKRILLASASPRRRELMALAGYTFDTAVPEIDETPRADEKPRTFAERLAEEKARAVKSDGIVIAADTIVIHGETILGKPSDAEHARRMLRRLSGNEHHVVTAVCIMNGEGRCTVFSVDTKVVFRELEDAEIDAYIETGEPMDKAGAYAIQGGAAAMVRSISGSYTNVVGLPMCELNEALSPFL